MTEEAYIPNEEEVAGYNQLDYHINSARLEYEKLYKKYCVVKEIQAKLYEHIDQLKKLLEATRSGEKPSLFEDQQGKLKQLEQKNLQLTEQKQALEEDLKFLTDKMEHMNDQNLLLTEQKDALEADLKYLTDRRDIMGDQALQLIEQNKKLEERITDLLKENDDHQEELRQKEDEVGDPDRIDELKVLLNDMEEERDQEQYEKEKAKDMVEELQARLLELNTKIQQLTEQQKFTCFLSITKDTSTAEHPDQGEITISIQFLCQETIARVKDIVPKPDTVIFKKEGLLMGNAIKKAFKRALSTRFPYATIKKGSFEVPKTDKAAIVAFANQFPFQ
jgi:chromosome segregation ATPase